MIRAPAVAHSLACRMRAAWRKVTVLTKSDLQRTLARIDGHGYKAYKDEPRP
jgi:hypothetical protein